MAGALVVLLLVEIARRGDDNVGLWLATVLAGAAALGAPYVAEWLRTNYFAGELRVAISELPPFYQQTEDRSAEPKSATGETAKSVSLGGRAMHFYRIGVRNDGLRRAEAVEVVLSRLWFKKSRCWHELGFWEPVNLHWAGDLTRTLAEKDLNVGRIAYCDVGFIPAPDLIKEHVKSDWPGEPNGPRFVLDPLLKYFAQPHALPYGEYYFQLDVFASNAHPVRSFVYLQFHLKEWDEIKNSWIVGRIPDDVRFVAAASPPDACTRTSFVNSWMPNDDLGPFNPQRGADVASSRDG